MMTQTGDRPGQHSSVSSSAEDLRQAAQKLREAQRQAVLVLGELLTLDLPLMRWSVYPRVHGMATLEGQLVAYPSTPGVCARVRVELEQWAQALGVPAPVYTPWPEADGGGVAGDVQVPIRGIRVRVWVHLEHFNQEPPERSEW